MFDKMSKKIILYFMVCVFSSAALLAKELTVINLRVDTELEFKVQSNDNEQKFKLKYGEDSGSFKVPDQGTQVSIIGEKDKLTLDKELESQVVIFYEDGEKPACLIVPAMPREGENVIRIVNLTVHEELTVRINGAEYTLKQKDITRVGEKGRGGTSVQVNGQKRKTWQPTEPSSVLAILCDEAGKVETHFLANH